MLILGIDTATRQLGLALHRDTGLVAELLIAEGLRHCERLLGGLDRLLADLELEATAIEGIAVSAGPGSFTGIRIGIAAAQGLAVALDRPLVGVPTLEALAAGSGAWRGPVVACLDARRGEVYFCASLSTDDGIRRCGNDLVAPPDRVAEALPWSPGTRLCVVGDAGPRVATALEATGFPVVLAAADARFPRPAHVAALGARQLDAGGGTAPHAVEPIYLRRSDAELARPRPGAATRDGGHAAGNEPR
ncbi:MAG: tRNA (adenosine(37)-N6)-threonylcarbamoyltransferase complex dimerization subunit type 1 TsaB [Candidatus Eiseniibacteriota bacterium]